MSQDVILKARSNKADTKKEFMMSLMEAKKRSNTKVVNFSFGICFTPKKKITDKSNMAATKVNFFEVSNQSREEMWRHDSSKAGETMMRKTFHSGVKEAKGR
jgi:hypothetical protein